MAHSIPESVALAIRTDAGLVVHSGDWKIDPTPVSGWTTDEARLRAIGDEGVLALISDSTNILRAGESPSETEVGAELGKIIADAPGRVVVTTFASNVARMRSVALAAAQNGRTVVVVGRAMNGSRRSRGRMVISMAYPIFCPPIRLRTCRARRWCCWPPAARASREAPWRASPTKSIRT